MSEAEATALLHQCLTVRLFFGGEGLEEVWMFVLVPPLPPSSLVTAPHAAPHYCSSLLTAASHCCSPQVCYYRDKNSINKFQLAKVTAAGVDISGELGLELVVGLERRPCASSAWLLWHSRPPPWNGAPCPSALAACTVCDFSSIL